MDIGGSSAERYGLPAPSREDARESILLALDDEEGAKVWAAACAHAGVSDDGALDVEAIRRIAEYLKRQPGVVSVVGNSLAIRVDTYLLIAQLDGRGAAKS